MGLFAALTAVVSYLTTFYSSETFKIISFSYLPGALGTILFGPYAGLLLGFMGDFVGFVVKPMGAYFFGFAISAMVQNMIYALFLYRRRITLARVAAAQLLVVVVVYMGLNMLWLNIMYGRTAGELLTGARLIRNLLEYPINVALVYFLGRKVLQLWQREGKETENYGF